LISHIIFQFLFDFEGSAHPGFGFHAAKPIGGGRDASQVFLDVLFAYPAHRDYSSRAKGDRFTEDLFAEEDAFGMVS
jgi:hypothetical protein